MRNRQHVTAKSKFRKDIKKRCSFSLLVLCYSHGTHSVSEVAVVNITVTNPFGNAKPISTVGMDIIEVARPIMTFKITIVK